MKQYTGFSMVEPGAKSSLELNTGIDGSNDTSNEMDKSLTKKSKEITLLEGGDSTFTNSRHRPSSPAPYALHTDGSKSIKTGVAKKQMSPSVPSKSIISPNACSPSLRAPYAQPVLDASKLQNSKRPATSINDKISSARERREQQQQIIDEHAIARREREKASRAKWEKEQGERKKKAEETRGKEHIRRKEVEDRKSKQLQEEKKRAEAIVARSDEQAKVVLRQKRSSSVDKSKRWSWGAGGYGGGGGVATQATHINTAPSPFHYFDATRLTKRVPSHGNEGGDATPTSTTAIGSSSSGQGDRFSKSPLVMNTSHMNFASGLRSYESSPTQTKSPSPASARSPRARSLDSRQRNRTSSNNAGESKPTATRGRSPTPRVVSNLKSKGRISPQLTEPVQMSSRLLAPTKASIAMSKHDKDDTTHVSTPLRSRSSDRIRPSSAKSDVSSMSSSRSSPRSQSNKKPPRDKPSPGRSPSPLLQKKQPRSPVAASASPRFRSAESPRITHSSAGSRLILDAKDPPKRRPSPARLSSTPTKSDPALKKTPVRDTTQPKKSTPPAIKQTLRLSTSSARSKVSSPNIQSSSRIVPDKKSKRAENPVKKAAPEVKSRTPVKSTQPKSGSKRNTTEPLDKTFTISPTVELTSSNETKTVEESTTALPPSMNSSQVLIEKEETSFVSEVNESLERSSPPGKSSEENTPVPDEALDAVNSPEKESQLNENGGRMKSTTLEEANEVADVPRFDAAASEEPHLRTEEDDYEEHIPVAVTTNSLADEMQMALVTEKDVPSADVPPRANGESFGPVDCSFNVKTSSPKEETINTSPEDLPLDSSLLHQQKDLIGAKATEISENVIAEAEKEAHEDPHVSSGVLHHAEEDAAKIEETLEQIAETSEVEDFPPEADRTASEAIQIIESAKQDDQHEEKEVMEPLSVDIQQSEQQELSNIMSPSVSSEVASLAPRAIVPAVSSEVVPLVSSEFSPLVLNENVSLVSSKVASPVLSEVAPLVSNEIASPVSSEVAPPVSNEVAPPVSIEVAPPVSSEVVLPVSSKVAPPVSNKVAPPVSSEVAPLVSSEIVPPVPSEVAPSVPSEVAPSKEPKKKEKKLTPEEQAYKDAIAVKRREMKEKREREEKERLERLKLEAEEQANREEDARKMAEEARMEQLKLEEEERIKKEELEKKRKMEAEVNERKHLEYMREQRARADQKARDEAERIRKERDAAVQKKEEERLARRKRLEMIMRRTRGGDSPSNNQSSNPPSGDQSPANLTPTGGRSPYNSVTPDRVVSPVTVDKRGSAEASTLQTPDASKIQQALTKAQHAPSNDHNTSSGIDTIALEIESSNKAHSYGSRPLPPPFVAFEKKHPEEAVNHLQSGDFSNANPQNDDLGFGESLTFNTSASLQQENGDSPRSAFVTFKENINEVPTGNLLDL